MVTFFHIWYMTQQTNKQLSWLYKTNKRSIFTFYLEQFIYNPLIPVITKSTLHFLDFIFLHIYPVTSFLLILIELEWPLDKTLSAYQVYNKSMPQKSYQIYQDLFIVLLVNVKQVALQDQEFIKVIVNGRREICANLSVLWPLSWIRSDQIINSQSISINLFPPFTYRNNQNIK